MLLCVLQILQVLAAEFAEVQKSVFLVDFGHYSPYWELEDSYQKAGQSLENTSLSTVMNSVTPADGSTVRNLIVKINQNDHFLTKN